MSTAPRRFILQALDPDHGSPVLEALFLVDELDELHALIGTSKEDDPEFEHEYALDPGDIAAINGRFGLAFDPDGRDVRLCSWHSMRLVPYLSHTGYELPLLLEGRKPFARMKDAYPPDRHFGEDKFDRYVAQGDLHKEVVVEPFEQPYRPKEGLAFEGDRTVYYTRKGEEWRIRASKLLWDAAAKSAWSEDFERIESMLFGYEEWQNDWWMANFHKRRGKFGCVPIYKAVSAENLAWVEAAGYRALPPTQDSVLAVSLLYEQPNGDAAKRLMERHGAVALLQFAVRAEAFRDLVNGQSGPDYVVSAGRIGEFNRNIVGEIEIVAQLAEDGTVARN
jgi:hypothetical protein